MEQTSEPTGWVAHLRALMTEKGFNPRSLSLKAGLNATAVRDILEGRAKSPRYHTIMALAAALDVPPHSLMDALPQPVNDAPALQATKITKTPRARSAAVLRATPRKTPTAANKNTREGTSTTNALMDDDDLDLLTDVIAKLQEAAADYKQNLKPPDFAAMVTTLYAHAQSVAAAREKAEIESPARHLVAYEALRARAAKKDE